MFRRYNKLIWFLLKILSYFNKDFCSILFYLKLKLKTIESKELTWSKLLNPVFRIIIYLFFKTHSTLFYICPFKLFTKISSYYLSFFKVYTSPSPSPSPSPSLSHTHTHTHTRVQPHFSVWHTHSLTHKLSLSYTHNHTHKHSLTHTQTLVWKFKGPLESSLAAETTNVSMLKQVMTEWRKEPFRSCFLIW